MPPVMGAVAFMMVAITGIPYIKIIWMALIPALLYYLGVVWSAYIYSRKDDIPKVEMKVDRGLLLRRTPLFLIPITEIIVLMVIGFSAQYAACWSIVTLFIISLFQKDTRPRLGHLFRGLARRYFVEMPMTRQARGLAQNFIHDIRHCLEAYTINCFFYPGHMGHKEASASLGIMRKVCQEYEVPFLAIGMDAWDPRYTTMDSIKDQMLQFFDTMDY